MWNKKNLLAVLWTMAGPVGLVGLVFITYSNVYDFDFLYDDELLIVNNAFLHSFKYWWDILTSTSTSGAGFADSFYRPLQIYSYLFVLQGIGPWPWGFHLLNVVLHSLNAVMLFMVGRRLGLNRGVLFLAVMFWALHPMHVEAVTYMSATADPMHVFFMLLAFYLMLPDFSRAKLKAALVAFFLALLSKEPASVFPALTVLLVFLASEKRFQWKTYIKTWPFWALSLVYLILHYKLITPSPHFTVFAESDIYYGSFMVRLFTFLSLLPEYVHLLLWPSELGYERLFYIVQKFDGRVALGLVIFLLPLAVALWTLLKRKKGQRPWLAWGLFSFYAAFLPTTGLVSPVNSLYLEHWMYLPSLFLVLTAARGVEELVKNRERFVQTTAFIFVFILFAILGLKTYEQNFIWKDPASLYVDILKNNPNMHRVRHNLAMIYSRNGDVEQAIREYETVLEKTQIYTQTYHNLATIYLNRGELDRAEELLNSAIHVDPNFYMNYEKMAELYTRKGNQAKANEYWKKYYETRPQ